ncbi:MAG: sigma-54-dependent Fis family transcriptional regulator [Gluconacetobacter diazotrophicus]|nr:sigma-54-dependent Fis family transcriptional regulator [Gluconacetobacter diazotrophicus]
MTGAGPSPSGNVVALVEDDAALRDATAQALDLAGMEVLPMADAAAALHAVGADFRGIVVSDIRMPGISGLELFDRLHRLDPDLPVILVTGHGDIAMAVDAMRRGAYDFLAKPCPTDRLVSSVRRALEKRRLVLENRVLRAGLGEGDGSAPMLGDTPAMASLRDRIRQVARIDVDVLIEGETGTGKEVAARMLHRLSGRGDRPLVALNCGAVPETMMESELFGFEPGAFTGAAKRRVGLIEHSHQGTLFLDELESMPPALQVRFLRVLEAREIIPLGTNEVRRLDLRVVAAAKIDLVEASRRGAFRPDLFHRLNVVTIRLPPLRERRGDIPLLFGHFAAAAAARFRRDPAPITPAISRHLSGHDWPGNVRELRHFAERATLGLSELPDAAPGAPPGDPSGNGSMDAPGNLPALVDRFEADRIRQALQRCDGDVRATLGLLGIPRKTFYDKLARHNIDRGAYVPASRDRPTDPTA